MEGVIFLIISTSFVCLGIMIQTKILNKRHPNAELLIEFMKILDIQQDTSAIRDINNGKG